MKRVILLGLVLGISLPVRSASVVPNFTTGTVTSETTSRTEVTEIINQVEYSNATSYNVSGVNITGRPQLGTNYSQTTTGAAFQFSETYMTPGIATETSIERTTIIDSFTTSTSVFTQ